MEEKQNTHRRVVLMELEGILIQVVNIATVCFEHKEYPLPFGSSPLVNGKVANYKHKLRRVVVYTISYNLGVKISLMLLRSSLVVLHTVHLTP